MPHAGRQADKSIDGDEKRGVKRAGPSTAQSAQKTLNLFQTNFNAASGTGEVLTHLPTDLESPSSLPAPIKGT